MNRVRQLRAAIDFVHDNLIYWAFLFAGIGVGIKYGHPGLTTLIGTVESPGEATQAYKLATTIAIVCLLVYGGRDAWFGGPSEIE